MSSISHIAVGTKKKVTMAYKGQPGYGTSMNNLCSCSFHFSFSFLWIKDIYSQVYRMSESSGPHSINNFMNPCSISMFSQCCTNLVKPTCNIGSPVRTRYCTYFESARVPWATQQQKNEMREDGGQIIGTILEYTIGAIRNILVGTTLKGYFRTVTFFLYRSKYESP